jgi:hypothetical protein
MSGLLPELALPHRQPPHGSRGVRDAGRNLAQTLAVASFLSEVHSLFASVHACTYPLSISPGRRCGHGLTVVSHNVWTNLSPNGW